ncbi:MAG: hypothetical protein WKF59_06825 [Chitinophagaceae bacterium]
MQVKLERGVDEIMKFRNLIPEQYRNFVDPGFKEVFLIKSARHNRQAGNTEVSRLCKVD